MAALLSVAVSCGDDDGEGASPQPATSSSAVSSATSLAPRSGGSITFGVFSETNGLDPTVSFGVGVIGGTELAAIYDTVMRFDPQTGKYEPRTAQSLDPDATATNWTLRLRPGIKFSDGSAYDAAAVKLNLERHVATSSRSSWRSQVATIKSMEVVDALTLSIALHEPLGSFPYILSVGPGMIVSPTALQKPGADINTRPEGAGAGPFVVSSYKPKDSLTLSRNPSYWGGAVYLDEVKFVFLAGADATYQAFKTGTFNMAFLREPPVIKQAKDDKVPYYEALQYAGSVLWVNHVNSPTSDLRVRQAIAAAIDPAEFNRRVYNGTALTTSSLFSAGFPWDPQVPGHTYDTTRARALVAEAKAAGWDGRLRLDVINTPSTITVGLTLKTMLDVVGMTVDLNSSYDAQTYSVEILGKKNFHLAIGSLNAAGNDGAIFRIIRNLSSTSPTNNISWKSAEVEAAISKLRTASTDDQKKAGYKQVAEAFMRDIPAVVLAAVPETIIWNSNVHGVMPTADSIVLLSQAWIAA